MTLGTTYPPETGSQKWLNRSTIFLFTSICLSLVTFLTYIVITYEIPALNGQIASWNQHLTFGKLTDNILTNAPTIAHIFIATVVLGIGFLQIIPQIRTAAPSLHRWLGRLYFLAVAIAVVSGVTLLFIGNVGSLPMKLGFAIQTLLITWFGILAYKHARNKEFTAHRRWALRFFFVANIALFYRVIFVIWVILTGGIGIDFKVGKGWFLDVMSVGQFLPLIILEWYLHVNDGNNDPAKIVLTVGISLCALAILVGTLLLSVGNWFTAH